MLNSFYFEFASREHLLGAVLIVCLLLGIVICCRYFEWFKCAILCWYLNLRHAFSQLPDDTTLDRYPHVDCWNQAFITAAPIKSTMPLLIGAVVWNARAWKFCIMAKKTSTQAVGRDIRRVFWLKEGRSAFDKDFIGQIGQDKSYLEFCRKLTVRLWSSWRRFTQLWASHGILLLVYSYRWYL